MGKIRIYTDESVNIAIAEGLKRRGVDSFSAKDVGNLGLTDEVRGQGSDQAIQLISLNKRSENVCFRGLKHYFSL